MKSRKHVFSLSCRWLIKPSYLHSMMNNMTLAIGLPSQTASAVSCQENLVLSLASPPPAQSSNPPIEQVAPSMAATLVEEVWVVFVPTGERLSHGAELAEPITIILEELPPTTIIPFVPIIDNANRSA